MESKAFHICPFCHAPSPVSEERCKACGRSLVGLPLAVYGSELDVALAPRSPGPLLDLPLRDREPGASDDVMPAPPRPVSAAPNRARPAAVRRSAREPRARAIVGMAAALAAAIAVGTAAVRPRRAAMAAPASTTPARAEATPRVTTPPAAAPVTLAASKPTPVVSVRALPSAARDVLPHEVAGAPGAVPPRPEVYTVHPDVRAVRGDVSAEPVDVRRARQPVAGDTRSLDEQGTEPAEDTLVLRARLRRAEESRDRLAERVAELRARANVSVITDVGRYQRLQNQLESAREDLDRAEADVARWRRALRSVE